MGRDGKGWEGKRAHLHNGLLDLAQQPVVLVIKQKHGTHEGPCNSRRTERVGDVGANSNLK